MSKSSILGSVSITVDLSVGFISDLVIKAVEKSIDHWCEEIEYHAPAGRLYQGMPESHQIAMIIINVGSVTMCEFADGVNPNARHTLNLYNLMEGIKRYFGYAGVTTDIEKISTISCDAIIQLALFGKVKYS